MRFVRQDPSGRECWVLHTEYNVHSCLVTEVVTGMVIMKSRKRTRSRRTKEEEEEVPIR